MTGKETTLAAKTQSKKAKKTPAPMVRYSPAVRDAICERLIAGESLRAICASTEMPAMLSVLRWLADEDKADFRSQYARARELQAERMGEELLEIADEDCATTRLRGEEEEVVFDSTAVARNRLRVDARKWLMSKMAPKKYGDKVTAEHVGEGGGPLALSLAVTYQSAPARGDDEDD